MNYTFWSKGLHSSGRSPLVIGDQEPENYQSLNFDLFKSFEMRVDFSKYKEQMVARSIRGLTCKNKGWISRNKDRFSVHRTYIGFTMQSVQLFLLYLARMMRPLTTEQT